MTLTGQTIRKSAIQSQVLARAFILPLEHPGLGALREASMAGAGIDERPRDTSWGEATIGTHLLFAVVKGQVASGDVEAGPGEVIHVPPKIDKYLSAPGDDVIGVWVHAKDVRPWIELPGISTSVFRAAPTDLLHRLMEAMLLESASSEPSATEALPQLCKLFLHYLHRLLPGKVSARDLELSTQLTELWNEVSGRIEEKWTVARLSKRLHMSESHFHREVVRLKKRKPMEIVQGIRIDRAAMLLSTTNLGLEAIAQRVGYSSAYSLSHAFHHQTGLRPGAYRKRQISTS